MCLLKVNNIFFIPKQLVPLLVLYLTKKIPKAIYKLILSNQKMSSIQNDNNIFRIEGKVEKQLSIDFFAWYFFSGILIRSLLEIGSVSSFDQQ